MNSAQLPRTLVAVLYADVAGYSRLTEADEEDTHRRLSGYLDHFAHSIGESRGRVVHYAGDAVLATFASAIDALTCAARVQAEFAHRNEPLPEERRVRFRVGLNLGDVIEDRGDVYGDGVNVAARLEALAEPGGICISGSFRDTIGQQLPFDFDYLGEQQVKNITRPVRAYHARLKQGADIAALPRPAAVRPSRPALRQPAIIAALGVVIVAAVVGIWRPWAARDAGAPQANTSNLPRIAVLPFVNRSDDASQEYFADGVTEDIITDLSSLSGLVVIARSASFRYKGQEIVPQTVGKELGATYLLEGSVRRAGGQIRVTAQLVDARDGSETWAARYDRRQADLFALQDEVTHQIVKAMAIQITPREDRQLGRMGTSNFDAYDLLLQGQALYAERTRQSNEAAIAAYRRAIELDPRFARAYSRLGADDPRKTLDESLAMAQKGVALDPKSPQPLFALGYAHLFRGEHEAAADAAKRAIELAPNYADGYGLLAFIHNHLGRANEAIAYITRAMALNPHYTYEYPWNLGWAYYTLGQYPDAVEALKQALERNPSVELPHMYLAASYMALGQHDEAAWEIEQLRLITPDITLSRAAAHLAGNKPELVNRLLTHLREAGLPE